MTEVYQDIDITDTLTIKGARDCDTRIRIIDDILSRYTRPFTCLDIGSNFGHVSISLARKYPQSMFILIERDTVNADIARQRCEYLKLPNVIILQTDLTIDILRELGRCEYIDITLALSVVHHFGQDIGSVMGAIEDMSESVIYEMPAPGENACNQGLVDCAPIPSGEPVGTVQSHTAPGIMRTMYHVYTGKNDYFRHRRYGFEDSDLDCLIEIIERMREHRIRNKRKRSERTFYHGLNLYTYILLGGIYPTRIAIAAGLDGLQGKRQDDPAPWNYIIGNGRVIEIDKTDPGTKSAIDDTLYIDYIRKTCILQLARDLVTGNTEAYPGMIDWYGYCGIKTYEEWQADNEG